MVKSIVTVLVTLSILIAGAAFEQTYIHREFGDFAAVVETLDEKVTAQTATEEDALAVQKNWLTHKEHMHVFIPHTEIKEIDLWLSETVSYVKSQNWEEARAKIEVLAELVEQRFGLKVDKRKIVLPDAIKTYGAVTVELKLYPEIAAKITVVVKP